MLLKSIRFGMNDKRKARAFYDATFGVFGVAASDTPDEYPILMYKLPGGQAFIVGPARDGNPATFANGGTILLEAESDEAVAAWHAAGLVNGGAFGAYRRDPDGNKLGCYHGLSFG